MESEDNDDVPAMDVDKAAMNVVSIVIPVTICMVAVVFVIRIAGDRPSYASSSAIIADETEHTDDTGKRALVALRNAALVLAIILVSTCVFVLLFKYGFFKVILSWLMLSFSMVLGFIGSTVFMRILDAQNLVLDWISCAIIVWNFVIVGIVVIFWRGPLRVQQGYLILMSVLVASVWFFLLPAWSGWVVLCLLAIYDLCAVLCPGGPLKVLVGLAQKHPNQNLPGLVYSAGVMYELQESVESEISEELPSVSSEDEVSSEEVASSEEPQVNPLERKGGVKLGLGDFIFYSLLVAKAGISDWITVFVCANAIIAGMVMTMVLLGLFRKALPALPISIFLGVVFFVLSTLLLSPFLVEFALLGLHV